MLSYTMPEHHSFHFNCHLQVILNIFINNHRLTSWLLRAPSCPPFFFFFFLKFLINLNRRFTLIKIVGSWYHLCIRTSVCEAVSNFWFSFLPQESSLFRATFYIHYFMCISLTILIWHLFWQAKWSPNRDWFIKESFGCSSTSQCVQGQRCSNCTGQ